MLQDVIKQWEENKHKLEDYFRTTKQDEYDEYEKIVKKIVEIISTDGYNGCDYDATKITVVDNGSYQGTLIFLIPTDTYQPSIEDYLITHTYYGSCSGCDTLQGIIGYNWELPYEEQVKDYMTLALHLVQKMYRIKDTNE
jgi:hypothetical protein